MQAIEIKYSPVPPPQIYERARDKWGVDFRKGVVFTCGDTIHACYWPLEPDMLVHEKVHVLQQTNYPGGYKAWWERYFEDEYFRYSQEMEAYRAQYKNLCERYKDKNQRSDFVNTIISHLRRLYGFEQFDSNKIRKDLLK